MKKIGLCATVMTLLASNVVFGSEVIEKGAYTARVNGVWLESVIYENKDHAHMLPVREICEIAGLEVQWDQDNKMVTVVSSDNTEAQFVIGEDRYIVNGTQEIQLNAVAEIKDNYSYVPSPFFSKIFGFTMKNEPNEVIDITFGENENEEKEAEDVKTIEGMIEDATMNTLKIKSLDGQVYQFDTLDADKSGCDGLLIGSRVIVSYQEEGSQEVDVLKAIKVDLTEEEENPES